MTNNILKYKVWLGVGIIWLFHLSAVIGISMGNLEWFIEKTPINLGLSFFLFVFIYPIDTLKKMVALLLFFVCGMFAEWLGVNYQILFGEYTYGDNFGPKLDGVPYLIGVYWSLLTFITASILDYTDFSYRVKVISAALLMVLLDFFMEKSAPIFNFWDFMGGMPTFENYWTWFLLGILFQIILKIFDIKGNKVLSLNLYAAQLFFFVFFYFRN